MMKSAVVILFIVFFSNLAVGQSANDVIGRWQSAHGSGQIEIFKRGQQFFGKIVWLREPEDEQGKPKRDIKNPLKELKSKPIIGLEVLKDFDYKGNGLWSGGKIYDPKSGNTYNCQMSLKEKNELNIRAFFGLNILGRTETWRRVVN